MKIHIQFTPALTVALLCAGGWFVFWLLAFRPATLPPVNPSAHPEFTRLITDDAMLNKLKAPTLFALPSEEGFSGRFFKNQIDMPLSFEKTNRPSRYLSPEKSAILGVDRNLLMTETALPRSALPIPGTAPRPAIRPAENTQLFLSPELELRTGTLPQFNITADGLPETVRINLAVRADGTVEYAFSDKPVTNTALLRAVRQIPFNPAKNQTEGWIDIRFPQEGRE